MNDDKQNTLTPNGPQSAPASASSAAAAGSGPQPASSPSPSSDTKSQLAPASTSSLAEAASGSQSTSSPSPSTEIKSSAPKTQTDVGPKVPPANAADPNFLYTPRTLEEMAGIDSLRKRIESGALSRTQGQYGGITLEQARMAEAAQLMRGAHLGQIDRAVARKAVTTFLLQRGFEIKDATTFIDQRLSGTA